MKVICARNVNQAYRKALKDIRNIGLRQNTRAGPVLVAPYPVTTIYEHPTERVLLDTARDANPFFHLFESLWILQGRQDCRWLDKFVSDFSSRFGEENGLQHGAYGFRMRNHFDLDWEAESPIDQLILAVHLLKQNHNDRRVVIQLWDAMSDLGNNFNDHPCNTQIFPRIVNGCLDITVTNRSNDIIWGAYGANAVHFSVIQEVMAAMIGVEVGKYYQISNNWHGYTETLMKYGAPQEEHCLYVTTPDTMYSVPLVDNPVTWLDDLDKFMENPLNCMIITNPWFMDVAQPMMRAHNAFKVGKFDTALSCCDAIQAPDWRFVVRNWLMKRKK